MQENKISRRNFLRVAGCIGYGCCRERSGPLGCCL